MLDLDFDISFLLACTSEVIVYLEARYILCATLCAFCDDIIAWLLIPTTHQFTRASINKY